MILSSIFKIDVRRQEQNMLSNTPEEPAIGFADAKWIIPSYYRQYFDRMTFIIDFVEFDSSTIGLLLGNTLSRTVSKYTFDRVVNHIGGHNLCRLCHEICRNLKVNDISANLLKELIKYLSENLPNMSMLLGTKDSIKINYLTLFDELVSYNKMLSKDEIADLYNTVEKYVGAEYLSKKEKERQIEEEKRLEEERRNHYYRGYGNYYSGNNYNYFSGYANETAEDYSNIYEKKQNNRKQKKAKIPKVVVEELAPIGDVENKKKIIDGLSLICDEWPIFWSRYAELMNVKSSTYNYNGLNYYGMRGG